MMPPTTGHIAEATAAERRTGMVRLVILFCLLPILWWDVISPESEMVVTGLTALVALYILATIFLLPRLRVAPRLDLFLAIDILIASALVHFTGGINSSLLLLLYLPVIAAAFRLDLRHTFLSAVAVSTIVIWMWNLAEGGLPALGPVALKVGLFTIGSLLLAFFFGVLAQDTRVSRERAALNRVLNEKLFEATAQLRRRVAELEASHTLSSRLTAAGTTTEVLEALSEAAQQQLAAPYCAIVLFDRLGEALSLAYTRGVSAEDAAPVVHMYTDRLKAGGAGLHVVEMAEDAPWARGICVPITAGGRLIGTICAGGEPAWIEQERSPETLASLAGHGAVALERAFLLEDLQRLALAEPSARLHTREQLDRIVHEEVKRATQLGASFVLLRLRVDDIPAAVDRVGEAAGDLLSRHLAGRILELARRVDIVARGDPGEFFVLLPMTGVEAARTFAAALRRLLSEDTAAARLSGLPRGPNIRVGIAAFPQDSGTGPELYFLTQSALDTSSASSPIVWAGDLTVPGSAGGPGDRR